MIDGFGTAYSSLSYLKDFPLNQRHTVVSAMIDLAHILGRVVITQG